MIPSLVFPALPHLKNQLGIWVLIRYREGLKNHSDDSIPFCIFTIIHSFVNISPVSGAVSHHIKKYCLKTHHRHDRNLRFSKSPSHLKIYYSRLTPVISRLLIVNTMLPAR
jgi:hypothetical protein